MGSGAACLQCTPESGRQLGEANTRPFHLSHRIPAETLACKYQGSRNGRLINISALRIAMSHFDEAVRITNAVRDFHLRQANPENPTTQPGVWDLYIISRASLALIAFQKRNKFSPATDAIVSDTLASQYQFISGVFMICREMMNTADPAITENRPISADALFAYADDKGIFVSANGMACAGSEKKIMDFLACCNGNYPEVEPSEQPFKPIKDLVPDLDRWYRYALATIELDCFIELEYLRRQKDCSHDRERPLDAIANIYRGLSAYCASISNTPAPSSEKGFEENTLLLQNHILSLLGWRPQHRITAKAWSQRMTY